MFSCDWVPSQDRPFIVTVLNPGTDRVGFTLTVTSPDWLLCKFDGFSDSGEIVCTLDNMEFDLWVRCLQEAGRCYSEECFTNA